MVEKFKPMRQEHGKYTVSVGTLGMHVHIRRGPHIIARIHYRNPAQIIIVSTNLGSRVIDISPLDPHNPLHWPAILTRLELEL